MTNTRKERLVREAAGSASSLKAVALIAFVILIAAIATPPESLTRVVATAASGAPR